MKVQSKLWNVEIIIATLEQKKDGRKRGFRCGGGWWIS